MKTAATLPSSEVTTLATTEPSKVTVAADELEKPDPFTTTGLPAALLDGESEIVAGATALAGAKALIVEITNSAKTVTAEIDCLLVAIIIGLTI